MTPHLESGRIHLVTTKPESGAESEDPRTLAEQRILAIKESARSATTEAQLDALYAGILKEVEGFKSREKFETLVQRERENLKHFFGRDIDVPPLPDLITPEQREKWKEMGFELHYLPAEEMTGEKKYPGWQLKPDGAGNENLFSIAKNDTTSPVLLLPGSWVLVDARPKPNYKGDTIQTQPQYDQDPLSAAIEELRKEGIISHEGEGKSRFWISWEELHKPEVRTRFSEILGVSPDQIRLPRAIEWNFLGNAYYPYWGGTSSREWFEENCRGEGHLIGGGSSGGLRDLFRVGARAVHSDLGFRPLVVFS